MMRSLPSRTCAKIAPRPAVEASVYRRKAWLKSRKAVIGLVVSSFEAVEGGLAVLAPVEDRVLPGQGM